jgi:hypothetical protein
VAKFIVEREIPEAGELSGEELEFLSRKLCESVEEAGPRIQWVDSYVTEEKVYCTYDALNEETIREQAARFGIARNRIFEIKAEISPVDAEI